MNGLYNPSGIGAHAAIGFGIDVAIKATALLLVCWLLHAVLGRRRVLVRSALWNACLLGLLCLPAANLSLPRLAIGVGPLSRLASAPERITSDAPGGPAGLSKDGVDPSQSGMLIAKPGAGNTRGGSPATMPLPPSRRPVAVAAKAAIGGTSSATRRPAEATVRGRKSMSWGWPAVGIYAGIAGLLALRLAGSLAAVGRLRGGCGPVETRAWLEARDRWAAHLGLGRPVALLRSEWISVPVVVGYARPAIILPQSMADEAAPGCVDAVLLHELGHVRRGDFGWNLLLKLAQILYWPYPPAWLLGRVIRSVREQACDDLCVHALGGASTYRASLVEVASRLVRYPGPALGMAMARPTDLGRRLAWIDRTQGAPRCLLRWPSRFTLVGTVLGLAGLVGMLEPSRSSAKQAEEPKAPSPDSAKITRTAEKPKSPPAAQPGASPRLTLDTLIAAVRAEEEKYRNIEYTLRLTTYKVDPKAPADPGKVASEETRRVVLQGGRVWFRGESTARAFKTDLRREELSAYDGERTRTVLAGNSANIHIGRFEHPDIYPAHTVPLIHYRLNFPLSVYLSGADAIHADPKYPRFERETGTVHEFPKVEARVEGEERVDGLRCVKVVVRRWHYSNDAPILQHLWLAPERNYLCVKEQLLASTSGSGDLATRKMRAEELREIAPGLWFPMKITVVNYDRGSLKRKAPVVDGRTVTTVEQVTLDPHHDPGFFRDVAIPAGLPVFTIRDRSVVGSSLPEPVGDDAEQKAKLQEVVARVREQEQRYNDLEVRAHVDYRHHGDAFMEGIITRETDELRSDLRGASAYFTKRGGYATVGGVRSEQQGTQAFDGQWTRGIHRSLQDGEKEQRWASLRKGGGGKAEGRHDGLPVLRPHTLLVRDDWLYGPLGDLLVSPWHDKINKYRIRFRYCGEEELDGHPCVKLRSEVTVGEGRPPSSFTAYWLATDRNYIPIKLEHYGGNFGLAKMPTGISRCDDLREIAPGVWYPFRATLLAFDDWIGAAQNRITLNWRRAYTIDAVTLSPPVDAALFHDIVVPAGTEVQVSDEDNHFLGQFTQEKEGIAEVVPARYLSLLSEAKVRDEEQKARQRAIDALIGKPAPEFPAGATWLNGKPLTWESLRGKVVILDFWAEWCGPCRNDFPQLSLLHEAREANGLTLVGVHPPGSQPEAINKVMDEFHLDYTMCIDVPPREGMRAWGDLFGQFAVQAIPHAVAVDGRGTIVACGRLQDVLAKATQLTPKR